MAYKSSRNFVYEEDNEMGTYVRGLPYGADTAFGYTTIIDPGMKLRHLVMQREEQGMQSPTYGMNQAELTTIDWLIQGKPLKTQTKSNSIEKSMSFI